MSLQMKSIQLKGPPPAAAAAATATTDAGSITAECKTPIEEVATKEAEAAAEATCLD